MPPSKHNSPEKLANLTWSEASDILNGAFTELPVYRLRGTTMLGTVLSVLANIGLAAVLVILLVNSSSKKSRERRRAVERYERICKDVDREILSIQRARPG